MLMTCIFFKLNSKRLQLSFLLPKTLSPIHYPKILVSGKALHVEENNNLSTAACSSPHHPLPYAHKPLFPFSQIHMCPRKRVQGEKREDSAQLEKIEFRASGCPESGLCPFKWVVAVGEGNWPELALSSLN